MRRRDFVWSLGLTSIGLACTGVPVASAPKLGPYLCDPRPDAMGFFLEGRPGVAYSVVVEDAMGALVARVAVPLDDWDIGRADVAGLIPDTRYRYRVEADGVSAVEANFRTPPASRWSRVSIAITADLHWAFRPYSAFDQIRERDPTALLAIGDQIYADVSPFGLVDATEDAYRDLYPLHWSDEALAACWARVPTLLMWDDHEIIEDFDGRNPVRFQAAETAYEAYQGLRNPSSRRAGAKHYGVSLGPVDIFVLDTRSHRSPNAAPDDATKTMLGQAQRADLEAFLLASDAPLKLVVSPTPMHDYADTHDDAWAHGFRVERDALFAFVRDQAVDGVVLVSGDQHWPAVVRHDLGAGRSLVELQCTPTGAYGRSVPTEVGPDVLFVGRATTGFGWIEVDAVGATATARFAWIDASGTEQFTMPVETA